MLVAKELRIGNIVSRNGIVVRLDVNYLTNIEKGDGEFEPVPLTPEVMEKCTLLSDWSFPANAFFALALEKTTRHFVLTAAYNEYVSGPKVEYVHSLQNLYFALTGEELEIHL